MTEPAKRAVPMISSGSPRSLTRTLSSVPGYSRVHAKAQLAEPRHVARVVDVGVGQDDSVQRLRVEWRAAPVLLAELLVALEEPAIDEDASAVALDEVARARDGIRGSQESSSCWHLPSPSAHVAALEPSREWMTSSRSAASPLTSAIRTTGRSSELRDGIAQSQIAKPWPELAATRKRWPSITERRTCRDSAQFEHARYLDLG